MGDTAQMRSSRAFVAVALSLALQGLSAQSTSTDKFDVAHLVAPEDHDRDAWVPLAVLFLRGSTESASPFATSLARAGFAVAVVPSSLELAEVASRLDEARRRFRIEQGGMHAVTLGDEEDSLPALLAQRHQFQSITLVGGVAHRHMQAVERLPSRRVRVLESVDPDKLQSHLTALHAEHALRGAAAEVARTLDSLHDAAATADEDRYFAILPDDAVFLGTDASERWTGAEFRAFAMRYFERDSAWTYVPLRRHVTLAEGGDTAWFDEVLDNAGYGNCRGSGVLVRRGARWVLRQYNLTVPVPNELLDDVAARIRSFADGASPAVTAIVIAPSGGGEVPSHLRSVPRVAVPEGDDVRSLRALRRRHAGSTVLLAVEPPRVAPLLQAAGVAAADVPRDCGEQVVVVIFAIGGPRLLWLGPVK